ncbi:penicillin acylase family protein [Microbacterium sp. NPDC087665]|uniref:penicillin acylase family protein n=1 Tax=Microbacterium sp. NPDC087665 TaxID=3364194 RepID=UPI00382308D0
MNDDALPPDTASEDYPATTFIVAGLEQDAEIIVDRWGVPHISAQTRTDVFVAQGFNAARDRLFQIDLWRRRGLGRLAAAFGERFVEQDRANRLFRYRGDIEEEWAAYAEGTRAAVRSFVAGINAYIRWATSAPRRLPPEFELRGYVPELWGDDDIVMFRTHGLFYNAGHEVARARALRSGGPEVERIRQTREPDRPLQVPDGIDLSRLDDVMRTYDLAFAAVDLSEDGASEPSRQHEGGSNNWVVDATRTATGRPLLANDPHRAVTLPSLRYIAHLRAPGLDVIGAGEPGLPGITIGHNGEVAFGLTIWPADVEDLYVYDLDPACPDRYLGPEGWTEFTVVTEHVEVKGQADDTARLLYTVHGPVIHVDVERGFAVVLRAAWLEPGMVPYLASIGYNDAVDADEFVAALSHWGAPAVNQIFATPEGDWGWQASGKIPRRDGWDGSLPVPGDGSHEWNGLASTSELPAERTPARGWFASANEENLPRNFAEGSLTVTHDWYSSARAERISEWLSAEAAVSVESSAVMQMDVLSEHALRMLRLLDSALGGGDAAGPEWNALRGWDGRLTAESREALVFEIWARKHLRPRLAEAYFRSLGMDAEAALAAVDAAKTDEASGGDLRGDLELIEWVSQSESASYLLATVRDTVASAVAQIESMLGPESDDNIWAWGRLLHVEVRHPVFSQGSGPYRDSGMLGPLSRGGSGDTVGLAAYDGEFRQATGSTFRMVVDVGNWDASVASNSPGQSGDPRSPHYSDLFEGWVEGHTFPLSYTSDAVRRHAEHRIVLRADPVTSPSPLTTP